MWIHQKVGGTLLETVPDLDFFPSSVIYSALSESSPLFLKRARRHEARFLSCPVTSQKTVFISRGVAALVPCPPGGDSLFIQRGSLQASLHALHGRAVNS